MSRQLAKFWSKISKLSTGCWEWLGLINNKGYGTHFYDGKNRLTHRISFGLANPGFDTTLSVLHTCDNPKCVNPTHLFLGTQLDNVRDMISKGRDANCNRTHCQKGHLFSTENTKVEARPDGHKQRVCLACARTAKTKYRQQNRNKHVEYMREYNKTYKRKVKTQ